MSNPSSPHVAMHLLDSLLHFDFAGVHILTGIGNQEWLGVGVTYGTSAEYTLGAGLFINNGASAIDYTGLIFSVCLNYW